MRIGPLFLDSADLRMDAYLAVAVAVEHRLQVVDECGLALWPCDCLAAGFQLSRPFPT